MKRHTLRYDSPACGWSEGLPIGSGRIGAVIQARLDREIWRMSELTYWSGRPETFRGSGEARKALEEMRACFFDGEYAEGDRLAKRHLQPPKKNFGTHLGLCEVVFEFDGTLSGQSDEEGGFFRELDLERAVVSASERGTNVRSAADASTREAFASHADDIVVGRMRAKRPGSLNMIVSLRGPGEAFAVSSVYASKENEQRLSFEGQALEKVHSDGTCGVHCVGELKIEAIGGRASEQNGQIVVSGADEVYAYFAVDTDYNQPDESWRSRSAARLEEASCKGYEALLADHLDDYRPLFERVKLDLGASPYEELPTDARIRRLRQGQVDDPALVELFFHYGRYLTIAGAREDSPLPLHLQGIWNDGEANRMAWSCDYHLDVNTQMNYYPTEIVNLGESHKPLMRYVRELARNGRSTAEALYGAEGWVAHVFSNAWGFTLPGWETGWGLNVTGGLWIAMQLIEHYEYEPDERFLEEFAYPVLKEAAAFFMDYTVKHPRFGWRVTGPSNSPENSFYAPDPAQGTQQLSMGPTMDTALVEKLLRFCSAAARALNKDAELRAAWEQALNELPPLRIGRRGQLQEWLEDYEEAQPEHRHLSHLFPLYPDSRIDARRTPKLAEAARFALEQRRGAGNLEDVEFTAALFALCFARLGDGDRALDHLHHLIGELCLNNLLTFSKAGIAGAETNIFVIDGNFGGTAAVAELLLRSRPDEIELLPALPSAWSEGSVFGLRAKGGAEIGLRWKNGRLLSCSLRAVGAARLFNVRYGERELTVELTSGETIRLDGKLRIEASAEPAR